VTQQKDLKRAVRSRMRKTGESYTTARAQLLKKKSSRSAPPAVSEAEPKRDLAAAAGMSDDAVRAKTGRNWQEWVRVLDAAGAASMPHREIATYLSDEQQVPGWWAQMVTVGYERIRGLRDIGQRRGGSYEAGKSKTLPVPLAELYRACSNARKRVQWLPNTKLVVRKATPERTMRITWADGTAVEMYFIAKGEAKSQLTVQHRKLPTRAAADEMKSYWGARLDALAGLLAPSARRPR
jgi:uncharacterized protein YndB with AHSA1/START domain